MCSFVRGHLIGSVICGLLFCLVPGFCARSQDSETLNGSAALKMEGDISAQMVMGIDKFLMAETARSIVERQKHWHRDFSSARAYEASIQPNRERLRKIIGAVDPRISGAGLEFMSGGARTDNKIAETDTFAIYVVRWQVFEGVYGEGLLLKPKSPVKVQVVALPDADQTPEMVCGLAPGIVAERQFARRLAEQGCEVLVPVLIDRQDTWSGNPLVKRFTNQPHREWIYRQAYELGRHIIGYEVQKVLAAVDCFEAEQTNTLPPGSPTKNKMGVLGYGEGSLIAFYAAALDPRIDVAVVSGYFDSRQLVWQEPIYRNVFGLLDEFGDAEIATLVVPRRLIIEHSAIAKIDGPPRPHDGRSGAAPGRLVTPDYESVEKEVARAGTLLKGANPANFAPGGFPQIELIGGNEGMTTGPFSERTLAAFLTASGVKMGRIQPPGKALMDLRQGFDPAERQHRQVKELVEFTQKLLARSEMVRADVLWNKVKTKSPEEWQNARGAFQTNFWEEVIGRFPASAAPPNPRSRRIEVPAEKSWTAYEVVLDVYPEVFAWGYVLVPKDIKPGERRPVVVCQHGLEGVPADVINENTNTQAFRYYKAFAAHLADRGFVTFAPHNPYRGEDKFRVLQRKANPLKKTLFSVIIAQHDRILDWLSGLPFVDPKRIGFYGLSYGGKTAMRVPAVLDRYALSVCSGDFNEWIRKNAMVDFAGSYLFTMEYEMPEFDLGMTFNYAEMAALIAPRPFMVERGHNDGVGIDEMVAYEYARVRMFYDAMGIGDRTEIEFFNGPHTINGVGTFEFLHKHLQWPRR